MLKITILHEELDNFSLRNSGFSVLIQKDSKKILLDFGKRDELIKNLKKISLDINDIDYFVLSHGHIDHIEGMKNIRLKEKKKLFTHPLSILPKFDEEFSIGFDLNFLKKLELFDVVFSSEIIEFSPDIFFMGEIPSYLAFEREEIGKTPFGKDFVVDDSCIAVKTNQGLVLISGCGHSGICNMIKYAEEKLDCKTVAVVGGFHLLTERKTLKTVEFLRKRDIDVFYGHCVDNFSKCELNKIGGIHFRSLQEIVFE